MINKNLNEMTYNDYAALSLGEAQSMKRKVDELIHRADQLTDIVYEQGYELAEMRGEIHE